MDEKNHVGDTDAQKLIHCKAEKSIERHKM